MLTLFGAFSLARMAPGLLRPPAPDEDDAEPEALALMVGDKGVVGGVKVGLW